MKHSRNDGAGYVVVDHTNSPGITVADVARLPEAVRKRMLVVGPGELFERDTKTCSHCQAKVILNPGRVRDRAVCPSCDRYICDECDAIHRARGGACVPFERVLERAAEKTEKFLGQPDHPDAALNMADLSKPPAPRIVLTDR